MQVSHRDNAGHRWYGRDLKSQVGHFPGLLPIWFKGILQQPWLELCPVRVQLNSVGKLQTFLSHWNSNLLGGNEACGALTPKGKCVGEARDQTVKYTCDRIFHEQNSNVTIWTPASLPWMRKERTKDEGKGSCWWIIWRQMSGSRLGTKRRDSLGAGAGHRRRPYSRSWEVPFPLVHTLRKTGDSQSPAASLQPERGGLPLNW